jgi:hypothetical protein
MTVRYAKNQKEHSFDKFHARDGKRMLPYKISFELL